MAAVCEKNSTLAKKIEKDMIYCISKTMEISACHSLKLSYESKCSRLHGHNWEVTVYCAATELNADGMVIDFKHVKDLIHGRLDHGNLNELLPFNPTAENIAAWIVREVKPCYKALVKESYGNVAMATDDTFPIDQRYLI